MVLDDFYKWLDNRFGPEASEIAMQLFSSEYGAEYDPQTPVFIVLNNFFSQLTK